MKSANRKLSAASGVLPKVAAAKRQKSAARRSAPKSKATSKKKTEVLSGIAKQTKQDRVISLLQRPEGVTLDTMIKETDWQKHSLRGFLAGTVRKKLKLALTSEKIDGIRTYRIGTTKAPPVTAASPKKAAGRDK